MVCLYYRATIYASTGVTPALLMLGCELHLPVDLVFPPMERTVLDNYPDYVAEIERRVHIASEYTQQHLHLSWEAMSTANWVSRHVAPINLA